MKNGFIKWSMPEIFIRRIDRGSWGNNEFPTKFTLGKAGGDLTELSFSLLNNDFYLHVSVSGPGVKETAAICCSRVSNIRQPNKTLPDFHFFLEDRTYRCNPGRLWLLYSPDWNALFKFRENLVENI